MSKKENPIKIPKRPTSFGTPAECVRWVKKSVYLIARGRALNPEKPNELSWFTIGTGCVVAPNRMSTAAHVINDPSSLEKTKQHQSGDQYYLIRHDDEGNWHFKVLTLELNKNLFLYSETDLGIIYLDEEFYQIGEQILALKDDYIRVDQKFRVIGTEVAVLGYPLCKLDFIEKDPNRPQVGDILLRVDTGVINCRYRIAENVYRYEFTMGFNPGNSGGPIFDWRTGQLLSLVHGYKAIPVNMSERVITDEVKKNLKIKDYDGKSFIEVVHANYSVGYATPSFVETFKIHGIVK
ncbi:MAG TPA: serine protease [Candidatus Paceibacterota bacterium]|nr:serine protease [Candidatus Paceibacterota bacterium]